MQIPVPPSISEPVSESIRPTRRRLSRWLVHGTLFAALAAGSWAVLVWPQWIALDGARTALELQRERERELSERIDAARAGTDRLRAWDREGRRVFLADEVSRIPILVQAIARQERTTAATVQVTNFRPSRWRPLAIEGGLGVGEGTPAEIRPRSVRIVLKGGFEELYRTVASLSQQQQLFIPDRWELAPLTPSSGAGSALRAEIWATVFVVRAPEEERKTPVASGPLATRLPLGSEG